MTYGFRFMKLTADGHRQHRTTCPAFYSQAFQAKWYGMSIQDIANKPRVENLFSRSESHLYPTKSVGYCLGMSSELCERAVKIKLLLPKTVTNDI